MLSTDPRILEIKKKALDKLLKKRSSLEEYAAELAKSPASYGITGSVSVTNQKVADVREEIATIDMQIKQLVAGEPAGISLSYPNYRWRGWL